MSYMLLLTISAHVNPAITEEIYMLNQLYMMNIAFSEGIMSCFSLELYNFHRNQMIKLSSNEMQRNVLNSLHEEGHWVRDKIFGYILGNQYCNLHDGIFIGPG